MREALSNDDSRSEAAAVLKEQLEAITIHPGAGDDPAEAEVSASLVRPAD